MRTAAGIATLILWIASMVWFYRCASEDWDSWDNPLDQFLHPYSRKTQILLIPTLMGWLIPLALLG